MAKHLQEAGKNAMYTSKTIQNDLIECIGGHIRDKILKEVKETRCCVMKLLMLPVSNKYL